VKRRELLLAGAASALAAPTLAATPALGLTLPLTGVQAEVAKELEQGYRLALQYARSPMRLIVMDDASNPEKTVANIEVFAGNASVIAVSGIVGTPHAQAALPVARAAGLPVVGLRSGAQLLRDGKAGVYHLRASYESELDKLAALCAGAGMKKLSVLYSNDSFGTGSRDHLLKALAAVGVAAAPPLAVERNGENIDAVAAQCAAQIKGGDATGVVLLLIAKPMVRTAAELRLKHGILLPLYAMSFVATRSVASDDVPGLNGLGLVLAFPLPRSNPSLVSQNYRTACLRHKREDLIESLTAFEGFFYGSVVALTEASSREGVARRMNSGISVYGEYIAMDAERVGYRYLEIVGKSFGGKLRA
jgi:ABC-type branched-subunit amino acid transport system substrate-binding protein